MSHTSVCWNRMSHVITLLVVFTFAVKKSTSDCGNLSSVTPEVTAGETLQLKFIANPNRIPECLFVDQALQSRAFLYCVSAKEKQKRAKESRNESEYVYTIESITPNLSGRYFMRCTKTSQDIYSNSLQITVTQAKEAGKKYCGNLSSLTPEVAAGETLQLKFIANPKRIPKCLFMDRVLESNETSNLFCLSSKDKQQRANESRHGSEYVYTIESVTRNLSGRYFVRCRQMSNKSIYSNALRINVTQASEAEKNVTPPEVPQLTDLDDFQHCHQCIKALPEKEVEVTCKSEGGSPPIKIEIGIFNVSKELDYARSSSSNVSYIFNATEALEWATVFCKVENNVTKVPLSTNASVYLYRKPSEPKFDYSDIKEGEESDITCSTSGGRPPPHIYFKYNGNSENFTHTTRFENKSRTFNVSSVYKRKLHRWDYQNNLTCCVVHDLFKDKRLCKAFQLDVKSFKIQTMDDRRSDPASLITIVAISGSIVIVLTVVVVTVIIGQRKLKLKNSKKCKTNAQHSTETDNRLYIQETEQVDNVASIEPVEYSNVIPKHLRQNAQGNISNEQLTINEPSTGLVYAELDFEPSSRTTVSKRTGS